MNKHGVLLIREKYSSWPKYSLKKLLSEDLTIRNAPVGGHTCLTAGEQGEPAVVLYERINLSVPVGGPTAPGYATN